MAIMYASVVSAPQVTTTYNITSDADMANVMNIGQNKLILDIDLTLGNVALTLPSISLISSSVALGQQLQQPYQFNGLMADGGPGITYRIGLNIKGFGAGNKLTINPYSTVSGGVTTQVDFICGDSVMHVSGLNNCVTLMVAGLHQWMAKVCTPGTIS